MRYPRLRRQLPLWASLATVFWFVTGCNLELSMRAEARDQWKRQYTVGKGGNLEIRNTNGRIEVTPASGDVIEVVADRVVKAGSDEDAKNALGRFEIKETVSANQVSIDSNVGSMGLQINVSKHVDYVVRVPRGVNLKLVSSNGDIDVSGLSASFRAEATNGRVSGTALEGAAVVETTNGAVTLDFAKLGDEGISCRTTNGAVEVRLPHDVKARLAVRVTNGGISASGLDMAVTEQSQRRLDASLGGGGGPDIRVETTNGGVRVRAR